MIQPRDYQSDDHAAMLAAHQQYQRVLGRAATGLGKGVEIAMLAGHYAQFGRVLVLVDVDKLVKQLSATIHHWTGIKPGIEMADRRVTHPGEDLSGQYDRIVVSSFQTQYSGPAGKERFTRFQRDEFSLVIVDECETVFPENRSRSVVDYYIKDNPGVKAAFYTATPFRTDGVAAANIIESVAFNRDIIWGIDSGWLVPVKQAFVKVSLDFSTLKLRKGDDGEKDYSADEIAEKINNERTLIELAKGIIHVAQDRKSIVVCPNVASAHAITHYLESERPGCAQCIYGELGDDEKDAIFKAFERDEFQLLSSCMMLTKGFDSPGVRAVFNCRKTRSKRLYAQILGRSTRTLPNLVDGLANADERKAAIAASEKPDALMVNMVGVEDWVRDITVVDILGEVDDDDVLERAKRIVAAEGKDTKEAVEQAQQELDYERDQARMDAMIADDVLREQEDMNLRQSFEVQADVQVEYSDDLKPQRQWFGVEEKRTGGVSESQRKTLVNCGYPDNIIAKNGPKIHRWLFGRFNKKLVTSYKQIQFLRRLGATDKTIAGMTKDAASAFIESKLGKRRAG